MQTYNHHTLEEVLEAVERGHTKAGVARLLGVTRQTVYGYCKRWKAVNDAFEDKRRELVDLAELGLRSAVVNKEPWAITFALKTLGKNEGYTERQEVTAEITGKNGAPLGIAIEAIDYRKAIAALEPGDE